MAITRRVNQLSQMREDVPDLKAIESAVSNDFDTSFEAFVTGSGNPYIINGFALNMASNPIGGAASNLQVIVANGALMHVTASQSGTIFLVPSGTPNVTLNAATVSNVSGAFVPNTNNYVGIDYYRFQDPTTDVQRQIWDPSTDQEDSIIAPAAIVLNYEFVINSTLWASNILPIAVILTDSGNNVVSITDSRPLLFRLGTGGATPNPFYVYPWPEGTSESSPTTFSNSSNPFFGGDKGITDLKDWIDAVETLLLNLGGGPYWYSPINTGPSGSLPLLREDATNTILTGNGNIVHSAATAGLINWTSPMNLTIVGSELNYQIETNPTGTTVTLSDNEVAYLELQRDENIAPNLVWTNGSAIVTSVGSVSWTSGLYSVNANGYGDWIKITADSHAAYYQIQTINSSSQVTLATAYTGATSPSAGNPSQFAYGLYTLPNVTSTMRDIQISDRGAVPITPNTFWLLARVDNGGAIPRVFVRWLGLDLQQGDSEEISGPQLQNVLTYIGSPIESATLPQYVSAYSVYEGGSSVVLPQISTITTSAGSGVSPSEYFIANSSGNARTYTVWFKVSGSGSQPVVPGINDAIEVDILTGDTAAQVATKLAAALNNALPFADFSATAASTIVTITNNSAGTTSGIVNGNTPFTFSTTQSGTGVGNSAINDGDDLTLAIKKLDFELGNLVVALDSPTYDEVIEIVASGAVPPNSLNAPVAPGTNIALPNNSRESNIEQFYTVGKGSLMIFLNGQFLDLESGAYTEVGAPGAISNLFQIQIALELNDELEIRLSGGGGGGGGIQGPQGEQGPAGTQGPAGADALNGPINISTKTGNYTVLSTDGFLLANCASNPIVFTLPTAASSVSKVFYFKKIDSSTNNMIIMGAGSDLIDSSNTVVTNVQYEAFSLVSNGTQFFLF